MFRREIGTEHGSQAAAAQRLKTKPDIISRIVSGQRRCTLDLALRIEREYGIPAKLWTVRLSSPGEAAA